MKKIFIAVFFMILFSISTTEVKADRIAGESAKIFNITSNNFNNNRLVKKRAVLYKVLKEYNSPLINNIDSFLQTCTKYDLDCYLLPAISGLESYFGSQILANSNNPFGWGGGYIMFDSWESSINTVGKGLKENYINKGATTVEKIAPIYAASKTWASRVKYFINVFESEEEKFDSILSQNQVKL